MQAENESSMGCCRWTSRNCACSWNADCAHLSLQTKLHGPNGNYIQLRFHLHVLLFAAIHLNKKKKKGLLRCNHTRQACFVQLMLHSHPLQLGGAGQDCAAAPCAPVGGVGPRLRLPQRLPQSGPLVGIIVEIPVRQGPDAVPQLGSRTAAAGASRAHNA